MWTKVVGLVGALGLGYLACAPIEAEPAAWQPPPVVDPEAWAPQGLEVSRRVAGVGVGPEDVAIDAAGRVYTGVADGRILRLAPDGTSPEVFATLPDGRPLGMEFDGQGNLVVADGRAGIVSVSPEGTVRTLASEVDGEPLRFADDLDVAPDGTIWFSEASRRWSVDDSTLDAIEGVPTGRLLALRPGHEEVEVHLQALRYANGVAVTPGGAAVLVAETFGYRVTRLWLQGSRRGEVDRLVDGLPGLPDNVHVDSEGNAWIALVKERSALLDALYPWPAVRAVLFRLPHAWLPVPPPVVFFAVVGPDGAVRAVYRGADGFGDVTSVTPSGSDLWLGSLSMDALGHAPRPTLGQP